MKRRQTIIQKLLSPIANTLMGFVGGGYTATDPRRKLLQNGWQQNKASANTLLSAAGPVLRSHCRNLERNNPSARAGIEAINALVVGSGIALEPETGDEKKDAKIRAIFNEFIADIGVGGEDIYRLQSLAMREVVTVGEALWRIVPDKSKRIPLRILPLESEWLSDVQASTPRNGCTIVAGIGVNKYGQAVKYFLSPPEIGEPEEVDAGSIIHIFERRRPLQARGEPWLAPVIETLMNERDLVDAELYAAKQSAAMALVITSETHDALDTTEDGDSEDPAQAVRIGGVARLYPGEDIKSFSHTRPSQMIAPFRQMLRGDLAAALRIPQRFLDRDVSRANYSSMRADMLDTDRLLAPVREWMGHQSIGRLYELAAPVISAILGFYVDPKKYRLLPDAQPYVDPQKDIAASIMAIEAGLSNAEIEISKKGGDYRQVWAQLKKEQDEKSAIGLELGEKQEPAKDKEDDKEDDGAEGEKKDEEPTAKGATE
jgi:lambda family phage portal protein